MTDATTRQHRGIRRSVPWIGAALAVLCAAGGGALLLGNKPPRASVSVSAVARMADGHELVDSLRSIAAQAGDPSRVALEAAVALGYVERLRLGLGSPFRLAEFAMHDPRLSNRVRVRTVWALLDAAHRGNAHAVDARALAAVLSGDDADARLASAEAHLALIERELATGDPRAGELALRLAYQLAAAERLVARPALPVLAQGVALVRDRHLAQIDASRLFATALAEGRDPLAIIPDWRANRRFASERPPTEGQDRAIERQALPRVPVLLEAIRAVARPEAADSLRDLRLPRNRTPLLPRAAAERLAAAAPYLPPQGPVVVALRTHRDLLAHDMPRTSVAKVWVDGLSERVVHDEALAAENARTVWNGVYNGAVARVTLAASAGMRAYAQEAPWFPGMAGPSVDDLKRDYGFAELKFDRDVPAAWRPYFRRMLASAASDLRRVVPLARFDGLKVRFEVAPESAPLAVHDPGTRTLRLPVASAAGVLAHELAHDLDWQAARRVYSRKSGYSTDYAVRARNDRIAESVQGLTTARLVPPSEENGYRPPHDRRPAEVFARNFDWFVAVSLAREGRVNGYLSAVQDEVLTGYATVSAREVGGRGAESLMRLLGDIAFVAAPVKESFLEEWGPTRPLRSFALTRELTAPSAVSGSPRELLAALGDLEHAPARPVTVPAPLRRVQLTEASACAGGVLSAADRPQLALASLAADSRAKGIIRSVANRLPAGERPAWAKSALGLAPWSPELAEDASARVRDALLEQIARRGELHSPFTAPPAECP